jgi:biotin carboxylase
MKQILFVYARGGPPLEYSFPRIAACGALHVLALKELPKVAEDLWRPACTSIVEAWQTPRTGDELVAQIVDQARSVGADAVLTLSEFAVVAVAESCRVLGLASPGGAVVRARDKRLMRQIWDRAGVPIPRYRSVANQAELRRAVGELTMPVLLKAAWSAGSIGQVIIERAEDADGAWEEIQSVMTMAQVELDETELHDQDAWDAFLVEEIVHGSTNSWYEVAGYGDYLSVEGIVASGTYHPICITARMPTIPPFTEVCNLAPCVLPEPLQRRIEATARAAVDALSLDTCGTHTEIKLSENNELFVIETAARFGGATIVKEVETVFGVDMVQMLVRSLLGEQVTYPADMLVAGSGAAASVAVLATNSEGTPWTRLPVFDSRRVEWSTLISPLTTLEVVKSHSVPDGTPMPEFDWSKGSNNWAGVLFLTATDSKTILRDCYSILDNLEYALPDGGAG